MRVLGIDPGSRVTGYGIVDRNGSRITEVAHGTIRLGGGALQERLVILYDELRRLLEAHEPGSVAIEGIFHSKNAKSALKLGHARGVALLVASQATLSVHEYAPSVVKKAVTSSGRADKGQVQRMVKAILGLSAEPPSDAADALAIAICHANTARVAVR